MGFTDARPAPTISGPTKAVKYSVRMVSGLPKMSITIPNALWENLLGSADWVRVQFGSGENNGQVIIAKTDQTASHAHKVAGNTRGSKNAASRLVTVTAWANFKPGTKGVIEIMTQEGSGFVGRFIEKK